MLTLRHPLYTLCYTPVTEKKRKKNWKEVNVHLDIDGSLESSNFAEQVSNVLWMFLHRDTKSLTIRPKQKASGMHRPHLSHFLLYKVTDWCPKLMRLNVHDYNLHLPSEVLYQGETRGTFLYRGRYSKMTKYHYVHSSEVEGVSRRIGITVPAPIEEKGRILHGPL
jgi:hypothetical protein